MQKLILTTPDILRSRLDGSPDLSQFSKRYLAQGDSWFSIGSFPPWGASNILQQISLNASSIAVNCARPGTTLQHMTERITDSVFVDWFTGMFSEKWDAVLLSGGGNDMIDAALSPPTSDLSLRLLRRPDEWLTTRGPVRYISEPGWTTFTVHLKAVWSHFLSLRSKAQDPDVPVVIHTYDYITPRDAPAGPSGPWLFKAMSTLYKIPSQDWNELADELINRLAEFWISQKSAASKIFVVNTIGRLQRANAGATGGSGDWANEIHPSAHGYKKLAEAWSAVINDL